MKRKAPFEDIEISTISALIEEYIHNSVHRAMLRDWLIDDVSFPELESKYGFSDRHTKRIVYSASEKIFSKIH